MSDRTSAANPAKLQHYSIDGMALTGTLAGKATTLKDAITGYNSAAGADYRTRDDLGTDLETVAGDWFHLDEHAGDVANGFIIWSALDRAPRPGLTDAVFSVQDDRITQLGRVGFASRQDAIDAAEQLADDIKAAMEDGISTEEMEDLIDDARSGQYDPAFAVTFVNEMGVDGMVGIPHLLEESQPLGGRGGTPLEPGWPIAQLAPFAMILSTAMDTRADMRDSPRRDPDNEHLDMRLSQDWVDDFTGFDGEGFEPIHYSELIVEGELPADVLKSIGNRQLDDMLSGEPTSWMHLEAGNNILAAIGANEKASFDWLRSDDIAGDTTNMELILEYEAQVHRPMGKGGGQVPVDFGANVATVVDNGLQYPDDRSDALFTIAVDTVASEGEVHYEELKPVLGEGARTHMDQLADSTTRSGSRSWDDIPSEADSMAFLEAIIDNDEATTAVYTGATEYIRDETAETLRGGVWNAEGIGGVVGLVTVADQNVAVDASADRLAARQSMVDGVSLFTNLVGAIPVGGDLAGAAISLGSTGANEWAEWGIDNPDAELAADLADIANVRSGLRGDIHGAAVAIAYAQGTWTEEQIHTTAVSELGRSLEEHPTMDTDFFRDTPDGRVLKAYNQSMTPEAWEELDPDQQVLVMSPEEMMAYEAWRDSDEVLEATQAERTAATSATGRIVDDYRRGD